MLAMSGGLSSMALGDDAKYPVPVICTVPHQITTDAQGWRHASAPAFSQGPPVITDLAINQQSRSAVEPGTFKWRSADEQIDATVTNGSLVDETRDSGCHWEQIYDATQNSHPGLVDETIDGVRVSMGEQQSTQARYTFVFGTQRLAGTVSRPFVAVGKAGCNGATWCGPTQTLNDTSTGLTAAGPPLDFAVPSLNPQCAWMLTATTGVSTGPSLFRSVDFGTNWTLVATNVPVGHLVDQPLSGTAQTASLCNEIWGTSDTGVYRSGDGGTSFQQVFTSPSGIASASIRQYHYKSGPSSIGAGISTTSVFTRDNRWYLLGDDGHQLQPPVALPGTAESGVVAAGMTPHADGPWSKDMVVFTSNGAFEYTPSKTWRDVSPAGRPVVGAQLDGQGVWGSFMDCGHQFYPYTVVGHTALEMVFQATSWPLTCRGHGGRVTVPTYTSKLASAVGALLTPPTTTLSLLPGQSKNVPFDFRVPWHPPGGVDVDFVVDTTSSMDSAIDGIIRGLGTMTKAFANAGLDAQFGVASIKDLEATSGPKPYERLLKISPSVSQLSARLTALKPAFGGGTPDEEGQTFGVMQALTGAGFTGTVTTPGEGSVAEAIPPGQDAGFRPNATKVMVLVTDSAFRQGGAFPTITEADRELRAKNVELVGLHMATVDAHPVAIDEIRQLAGGSGALAPAGGVDCNGDGNSDVPANAPLVCVITQGGQTGYATMGTAIAHLVLDARPPVAASFTASGDTHVLQRLVGTTNKVFRASVPGNLMATGVFQCGLADAGHVFHVQVHALVFRAPVATSDVLVQCRDVPHANGRPAAALLAGSLAVQAPSGLGYAPPEPPPAQSLNVNPNPNPNPQSATHAAAGLAGAPQDEPQLALATERGDNTGRDIYLMSAALIVAAGIGCHRIRTARATAPNWANRR
jgi:hypothetical protein